MIRYALLFLVQIGLLAPMAPMGIRLSPTNTPPPPQGAGPQRTITCPVGATVILAGGDIRQAINSAPNNTTFCLRPGIYSPTAPIYAKTGTRVIGEYGAIIEGPNVTQSYDLGGIFIFSGWNCGPGNCDNVFLQNVVVRNAVGTGTDGHAIGCIGTTGNNWVIDHVEVTGCRWGVNFNFSSNQTLIMSYLHHNGFETGCSGNDCGGPNSAYQVNGVLYANNEIAYNGGEHKGNDNWNVSFQGNYIHNNTSSGIWCDGCDGYSIMGLLPTTGNGMKAIGNRVEDNTDQGIMCEISLRCLIQNNTIKRNSIGIFISSSNGAQVLDNVLENNFRGIEYFVYCDGINDPAFAARKFDLANDVSQNNTITLTAAAPAASFAGSFGSTGCTTTQLTPYKDGSKQLSFTGNTYHMKDQGSYWAYFGSLFTWAQWQDIPQDANSTRFIP